MGTGSGLKIHTEDEVAKLTEKHASELAWYQRALEKKTQENESMKQELERGKAGRERLAIVQERLAWESKDRSKDGTRTSELEMQLREMERQLEREKTECRELRRAIAHAANPFLSLQVSAAAGYPAGVTAPADARLRQMKEEAALSAQLASKLLGSLRDIKSDLPDRREGANQATREMRGDSKSPVPDSRYQVPPQVSRTMNFYQSPVCTPLSPSIAFRF